MSRSRARTGTLSLLAAAAAGLPLVAPATAPASTSGVVLSELRVGGPAGGNDEFVELLNSSAAPVAIGGWRFQGCASGSGAPSDRLTIPAGTTLPAGGRYLLTNSAASGYSGSVRGDASYTTGISNSGLSGARLVTSSGTAVDGIGFAGSQCAEGGGFDLASVAGTSGSSAHRGGANEAADSDDNRVDFAVAPANPQSSGGGSEQPRDPEVTPIHAIQGSGAASPISGQTVTIEGVVTGIDDLMGSNYTSVFPQDAGIFVQQEPGSEDSDPSSSEGVFVGYVRGPGNDRSALLGKRVRLSGVVTEKFNQTQVDILQGTQPTVLGAGTLPAPVTLDPAKAEAQTVTAVDVNGTRSYYETLEGMRVTLATGIANSGATTKFGALFLNPGQTRQRVFNTTTGPLVNSLLSLVDDAGAGDPDRSEIDLRPDSRTLVAADLFAKVENATGPLASCQGSPLSRPYRGRQRRSASLRGGGFAPSWTWVSQTHPCDRTLRQGLSKPHPGPSLVGGNQQCSAFLQSRHNLDCRRGVEVMTTVLEITDGAARNLCPLGKLFLGPVEETAGGTALFGRQ